VPRRAAFCLLCLALAGCRWKTGPDANFEQAAQLYQQLYATELDDAYGDPRMDEVVALLKKVEGRSIDAERAKMLLGTIERGREALAKQRAEREKMAAAAAASAARGGPQIDPAKVLAASAPQAASMRDPYGPGASVAEINTATGGCLVPNEPFREQGTGMQGTVYRLARSPACIERLPGFDGQALLVASDKVYRRMVDFPPMQGTVPDAGTPQPAPQAQRARPPPVVEVDAGMVSYYPGQPIPTALPDGG
jgi:hypothetical protein